MTGFAPGIGPSLPYPVKSAVTLVRSAVWRARTQGRPDVSGLRILLYHRVSDDDDPCLAAEGYRVVDLIEALDLLGAGVAPPRTIALTFDDGFADVGDEALPVLQRHGFRATVFVTTGVTDGRVAFPWYERQPKVLGWDEIVALDRQGTLRFEAHTVTHPSLLAVDDGTAVAEIRDSRHELQGRLGRTVSAFAYPAGLYSERERHLVSQAGYAAAVSCEPGVNRPDSDRFTLRRRQIDSRDRLLDFRAKVGGGHDTPLPLRGAYRRLRYGMRESSCA
jgi:peptidoglycan/xylan/chitin deacetylase (PgdA/CDA1 family)